MNNNECINHVKFILKQSSHYSFFFKKKEKLPQAFMQIVWMEDDFRNHKQQKFGQMWIIQSRDMIFQKVSLILCMSPPQVARFFCDVSHVTTVQLSRMDCTHIFTKFYYYILFMKMYLPSSFIKVC